MYRDWRIYLDIYNRDVDVWFCCMSLASVGLRPNRSSPNLHCTLIGRHTTARRRLRRWTPHPLPMPAPVTFLSLLPWHGLTYLSLRYHIFILKCFVRFYDSVGVFRRELQICQHWWIVKRVTRSPSPYFPISLSRPHSPFPVPFPSPTLPLSPSIPLYPTLPLP